MADPDVDLPDALLVDQLLGQLVNRAAAADHVVQDDGDPLAPEISEDVFDLGDLGLGTELGSDGRLQAQGPAEMGDELGRALVGGDDDHVFAIAEGVEFLDEQGQGFEHLHGKPAVESADLGAVGIPDDQPVDAGGDGEIGHQPGRGRLALELSRLVLAGIGQVRQEGRDVVGPVLFERPGGNEQGHHVLVDAPVRRRVEGRLEEKDVVPADVERQPHGRLGV